MSCETNTTNYIAIVEDLIKMNPSLYKSFNAAANFILKTDSLSAEQKKLSVHNFAHIYKMLEDVDPKFYDAGKADDVKKAVTFIDDNAAYISHIRDLFSDNSAQEDFGKATLNKKIKALETMDFIAEEGDDSLNSLLNFVTNFFIFNDFETDQDRSNYSEKIKKEIKGNIAKMGTIARNDVYKNRLFKIVDAAFDKMLTFESEYIDINGEVSDYAGLSNYLVILKDGTMIEAVRDAKSESPNALLKLNSDGLLEPISPDEILVDKQSRPQVFSRTNNGEEIFRNDELVSGFKFRAADPMEQADLTKALSKMSAPESGIKFFAVKVGPVGDSRVQRMKSLARDEKKFKLLSNRNHETFETTQQVAKLKSNPSARVLTVSRPKASEDSFAIMGKVLSTGQIFYVHSNDDMVFVDADNTTTKVDLSNVEDLKQIQMLSLKQSSTGSLVALSESDLRSISNASAHLSNLKEVVGEKFNEALEQGKDSVEITNEFFDSYSVTSKRHETERKDLLSQIKVDDSISLELPVVTVDAENNVIKREDSRKVPFYIKKDISPGGKVSYSMVSLLASNEFIEVKTETGEPILITDVDYARDQLNYEDWAAEHFKAEDAEIEKIIESQRSEDGTLRRINNSVIKRITRNFVIKFDKKGNASGHRVLESRGALSAAPMLASYISQLFDAITAKPAEKARKVKSFEEQGAFNFKGAIKDGEGQYALSFSLSTGQPQKGNKLQIELGPYGSKRGDFTEPYTEATTGDIVQTNQVAITGGKKLGFRFPVNESVIKSIYEKMSKSEKVKAAVASNKALQTLDLSTIEGVMELYNTIYKSKIDGLETKEMSELVDYVETELLQEFSNEIMRAIVTPLKTKKMTVGGETIDVGNAEFFELFEKDATFSGEYKPEYLFFDILEDGRLIPKIHVGSYNEKDNNWFKKSLSNLDVRSASSKTVSIQPKGVRPTSSEDRKKIDNTKIEKKPAKKPEAGSSPVKTLTKEQQEALTSVKRAENRKTKLSEDIINIDNALIDANMNLQMLEAEPEPDQAQIESIRLNMARGQEVKADIKDELTRIEDYLAEEYRKQKEDKRDDNDDDFNRVERFKLVETPEGVQIISDSELMSEVQFLSSILPQFGISLDGVKDVVDLSKIDGTVLGLFKNRVIYLNDQLKVKGVVFHEAFHGVFRYLMTNSERRNLIQTVMNDSKHYEKFTQEALMKFAEERGYEYNIDRMAELVAEEILADGFQNYMNQKSKKKKPSGIIGFLYDLLERLIRAFKAYENDIDLIYDKIATGYYKSAAIKSNMYDGQVAFELIPGPNIILNEQGNTDIHWLQTSEQNRLIDMVVGELLKDDSNDNFDDKFDNVTTKIIDSIYNIDLIINQNEKTKASALDIKQKYGDMFNAYRFMLGARMKGYQADDINLTGDSRYDNRATKNPYNLTGVGYVDNTSGQYSYQILKKLVKKKYDSAVRMDLIRSGDVEVIVNADEVEAIFDDENLKVSDSESNSANQELEGSNDFDVTLGNMNVIDSYVSQVRRFFSTIRRDEIDDATGAVIPRMLDGEHLFTSVVKVTSNLSPDKIISSIKSFAETMIEDGRVSTGLDFEALHNEIENSTKMIDGQPGNKRLYNMLVDVFNNVELNWKMFNVSTPKPLTEAELASPLPPVQQRFNFRVTDKVLERSVRDKRNQIITSINISHSENANTKVYKDAHRKLLSLIKEITVTSKGKILTSVSPKSRLNKLTNELNENMKILGIDVPKSLIRLSLMAIHNNEYKQPLLGLDPSHVEFYDLNENFIREGQYLEEDFFRSLGGLLTSMYKGNNPDPAFSNKLDDESKIDNIRRFMVILKSASAYIVKYDPSIVHSTILNAEGKSIYRFSKYNPMAMLAQRLRTLGLEGALEDEMYWDDFVRDFFLDNPMLGPILKGEVTDQSKEMQLFLNNFESSLFGGVQQIVGKDEYKDGKVFKDIDAKSLYILNMLSFLSRKTITGKDGTTIQVYDRSFHQLEATQTNFLTSSLHKSFVNLSAVKTADKTRSLREREGKLLYKDKHLLIVKDLEAVVRQEFNRIKREWNSRLERKENYELGLDNKNINKYNATLNPDGTVEVDADSLRAYNFNKLSDFFENVPELRDKIIELAKGGSILDTETNELVGAEKFEDIPVELIDELLSSLDTFAQQTYDNHLQKLVDQGVVEKVIVPSKTTDQPTIYYKSDLLPDFMRDSGISVKSKRKKNPFQDRTLKLNSIYPKSAGSDSVLESVLFDHFMNYWSNALMLNELMDGDIAMNVKNNQDYVKRLKKVVASGSNLKEGYHKVAYLNTIEAFIYDGHLDKGPYYNRAEIENDPTLSPEQRLELLEAYDQDVDGDRKFFHETYDGQSHSLLMHHMDIYDSTGRLDETAKHLMIAKHYRKLTKDEANYLKSLKIVLNSKKTVTAGLNVYHKLSEAHIDRMDVSYVVIPKNASRQTVNRIYDEIHSLYLQIYDTRKAIEELIKIKAPAQEISMLEADISNLTSKVHSYFMPMPHRKMLHRMLNSMEHYNVDQVMDTSASKNATLLPVQVLSNESVGTNFTSEGLINLNLSSVPVPNRSKYVQVETSGVKDYAKVSVQKKLLLPADINPKDVLGVLEAEAIREGKPLTESEKLAVEDLSSSFYKYKDSLNAVMKGRLEYFKRVIREGGDIDVAKLYDVIREGLESQGAASSILAYFATENGKPKFSPNLPVIRRTLEYYFMAQYSNNVTDEKAFGFKNFHESSFGYEVLEDIETGRIITSEEISKNPSLYSDNTKYRVRPLSVSVEVDPETGIKTHWVEAIVPAPFFNNPSQKQFWLARINKMFGVRIPTEDKRSMIAIKVVDFVDESKSNNVIVPHFIHLLSGSDFDIDSLFGQMKAFYEDAAGNFHLYGDYSGYELADQNTAQFIEWLHFMQNSIEFKDAIKDKKQELIDSTSSFSFPKDGDLDYILGALGFTNEDLMYVALEVEDKTIYSAVKQRRKSLIAIKGDIKKDYVEAKERTENNRLDRDAWRERKEKGEIIADLNTEINFMQRSKDLLDALFGYQATMDVLRNSGLPASIDQFNSDPVYSEMVSYKQQNKNLDATLEVLTNEAVFNRLFINQRASTEEFVKILDSFGLDLKEMTTKSNLYTLDNAISSKVENQMNKDGIGITAVMNKFLALASQYDLKLNEDGVVWDYLDKDGKRVIKDKFSHVNEQQQRVIALIGNILGMFADATKEPIPAALQWNDVNVNTTLSMIGLGLDPTMVAAFNFMPSVRIASQNVQYQKNALSTDTEELFKTFSGHLYDQLDPDVLENLILAGLYDVESGKVISSKIIFDFTPKTIDKDALNSNTLTPTQIGFDLRLEDGTGLADSAMEFVLTKMYIDQVNQSNTLTKASRVTNMFKRLNPTLTEIDNLLDAIYEITNDRSIFTIDSAARIFSKDSVYNTMQEMLSDLNEQASKLFLEKSPFFRPLVGLFTKSFKDKRHIAETITAFVGIRKFLESFPGSRSSSNPELQNLIDKDDKNLLDTFTPDYWFTHNLSTEISKFKSKYSDNKFLKYLRNEKGDATANAMSNDRVLRLNEEVIKLYERSKLKGTLAEEIAQDLAFLYNHPTDNEARMFVKRLFYHELARTGMITATGSFLKFFPPSLLAPISKGIDEFILSLKDASQEIDSLEEGDSAKAKQIVLSKVRQFFGKEDMSNDEVYDFFDNLLTQVAYSLAEQNEKGEAIVPEIKRLSWYYDAKKKNKSSRLVKNILEGDTKDDILEAKDAVRNAISSVFSFTAKQKKEVFKKSASSFNLNPGTLKAEFTIDMSIDGKDKKEKLAIYEIGRKMGISYDDTINTFAFPPLIKIKDTYYVYQGNEDTSDDKNMGETLVNSLAEGSNRMTILGEKATYTAIPKQFSSEMISPLGFTKEDAKRYKRLISKTEVIDKGNNTVNPNDPDTKRTPAKRNVVYTGAFVSRKEMDEKYPTSMPNRHAHHMTVSYRGGLDVQVGERTSLKVIGRLITDKIDALVLENDKSTNENPHITLGTANGVKPVEVNSEIKNNLDKVVPLNDNLVAIYGYYDGTIQDIVLETESAEVEEDVSETPSVEKPEKPIIPAQDAGQISMEFEDYNGNIVGTDEEFKDTEDMLKGLLDEDPTDENKVKPKGKPGIDLNDEDNC